MKLIKNKKAGLYFTMFQIGLLLLSSFFIGYYINKEMEDTSNMRLYFSRSIALAVSSSYAHPFNVFEVYETPLKKHLAKTDTQNLFDFNFENNFVSISGKKFPFSVNSLYESPLAPAQEKESLYIQSAGNSVLTLYPGIERSALDLKKLKFNNIDTRDYSWKSKQIVLTFNPDDKSAEQRVNAFISQHPGLNIKKEYAPGALAYIKIMSSNSSDFIAQIPYASAEKSRKLSSMIINSIIEQQIQAERLLGNAYITMTKDYPFSDIHIALVIGSNLDLKLPAFSQILYSSLEDFFEKWD